MRTAGDRRREESAGAWSWLFPITYLIHIAEELWGGEGFPAWLARVADVKLTPAQFLALNAVGLALMIVGVALAVKRRALLWLLVSISVAVLTNGLLHLLAALITGSYSPGLISGLALWVPLGSMAIIHLKKRLARRTFWIAAFIGGAIHIVISVLAFFTGKVF